MPGCGSQVIPLPQCSDRGEDVSTPLLAEHRYRRTHICRCHIAPATSSLTQKLGCAGEAGGC